MFTWDMRKAILTSSGVKQTKPSSTSLAPGDIPHDLDAVEDAELENSWAHAQDIDS